MNEVKRYFHDLAEGMGSTVSGLALTFKHFVNARKKVQPKGVESSNYFEQSTGIVTLEYPYEAIPVPDNGRYRLHNEMDDCIVCDKCAKICPVDCIDIVPIKSTEEIGLTSDGSSKRLYAAKFDIDMAKCCYCGLCTTVCPTECLTMTPTFDYSEFDIRDMNYHYTDLSPEQAEEKQALYERKQAEKAAAKELTAPVVSQQEVSPPAIAGVKPVFKPKMPAPKMPSPANEEPTNTVPEAIPKEVPSEPKKVVFKPKMPMPKIPPKPTDE